MPKPYPGTRRASARNLWAVAALLCCLLWGSASPASDLHLDQIRLPPGFAIELYAQNLPGARSLALGAQGTLFIGTRQEGKVYALVHGELRGPRSTPSPAASTPPTGLPSAPAPCTWRRSIGCSALTTSRRAWPTRPSR